MKNFGKTAWFLFLGMTLAYFMFEIAFVLFGVSIFQNAMSTIGTMKYVKIFVSFGIIIIGNIAIMYTFIGAFKTIAEQIHIYKYLRL